MDRSRFQQPQLWLLFIFKLFSVTARTVPQSHRHNHLLRTREPAMNDSAVSTTTHRPILEPITSYLPQRRNQLYRVEVETATGVETRLTTYSLALALVYQLMYEYGSGVPASIVSCEGY